MYILPAHWRKGIGGMMCREAEQILKSRTIIQMVLWVFNDNQKARGFYETIGFGADGAVKILNMGRPLKAIR